MDELYEVHNLLPEPPIIDEQLDPFPFKPLDPYNVLPAPPIIDELLEVPDNVLKNPPTIDD